MVVRRAKVGNGVEWDGSGGTVTGLAALAFSCPQAGPQLSLPFYLGLSAPGPPSSLNRAPHNNYYY